MFSLFKPKEVHHPKLVFNPEKKSILLSSNGSFLVEKTDYTLENNEKQTTLNVPVVPVSLFYSRGRLKSALAYKPMDDNPETVKLDIKVLKSMMTIPNKISNKNDIFVNGFMYLNITRSEYITGFPVSLMSVSLFETIKSNNDITPIMHFAPFEVMDDQFRYLYKTAFEIYRDGFYYVMYPTFIIDKNVVDACNVIKDRLERDKLITFHLKDVNNNTIEINTIAEGILFYSVDKFFSKGFLAINTLDQLETSTVLDIKFTNHASNLVLVTLHLSSLFNEYTGNTDKVFKMTAKEYNNFKPCIGDKLFLSINESEIELLSVLREHKHDFIPFPKECPLCNHELLSIKDDKNNQAYICQNSSCTGSIKDKVNTIFILSNLLITDNGLDIFVNKVLSNPNNLLESIINIKKSQLLQYYSEKESSQIYDTIQSLKRADLAFFVKCLIFLTTHKHIHIKSTIAQVFSKEIDRIIMDNITVFEDIADLKLESLEDIKVPSKIKKMFFNDFGMCKIPDFKEYDDFLYLIENKVILSK